MPTGFPEGYVRRVEALRRRLAPRLDRLTFLVEGASGWGVVPEVESLRPYVAGDDPRAIDWNLYARFDRVYVRELVREQEAPVHLLLDRSASVGGPVGERLAEVAAALGYLLLAAGHRVAVSGWAETLFDTSPQFTGEAQGLPLMRAVAGLPGGGGTDLPTALSELVQTAPAGLGAVVVLSDFVHALDGSAALERLGERGARVGIVHLVDRGVLARLPPGGRVEVVDPETGRSVRTLVGHGARRRVRAALADFEARARAVLAGRGRWLHAADASVPFEEIVLGCLGAREAPP